MTLTTPISLQLMIFLWKCGIVDSLSMLQFCINCGTQYGTIVAGAAAGNFSEIGPSVLLAPFAGLGTSYKYIRTASGLAERRMRIAMVASLLSTSATALTTDPQSNTAVGATISALVSYMRSINKATNTTNGGLVFVHPSNLSELTISKCIVFNVIIVGGILLIIGSYYILPRIGRVYCNYSQKLAQYTISFVEIRIDHLKKSRRIKKLRCSISKLSQKIFLPFKHVGFIENGALNLISYYS